MRESYEQSERHNWLALMDAAGDVSIGSAILRLAGLASAVHQYETAALESAATDLAGDDSTREEHSRRKGLLRRRHVVRSSEDGPVRREVDR